MTSKNDQATILRLRNNFERCKRYAQPLQDENRLVKRQLEILTERLKMTDEQKDELKCEAMKPKVVKFVYHQNSDADDAQEQFTDGT